LILYKQVKTNLLCLKKGVMINVNTCRYIYCVSTEIAFSSYEYKSHKLGYFLAFVLCVLNVVVCWNLQPLLNSKSVEVHL